jgi:hypothetical protein
MGVPLDSCLTESLSTQLQYPACGFMIDVGYGETLDDSETAVHLLPGIWIPILAAAQC